MPGIFGLLMLRCVAASSFNGYFPGVVGSNAKKSIRMNKIHHRRLYLVIILIAGLATATTLILFALKQNINVFLTPSQLAVTHVLPDYHLRLGGMLKNGSVKRDPEGLGVSFIVTDFKQEIPVRFVGVLPDLFKEGKGVIVEGTLNNEKTLLATQVLAKHDENYMPKNVYQALRKNTT